MTEDVKNVAGKLDLSVLGAATQKAGVDEVIAVASATGCATVCVNPCYVKYVAENLAKGYTKTCCVIGYPFGQQCTATKLAEARQAVADGADELDMVANVGFFKDGRDEDVGAEIAGMVEIAAGRVVKVIIESCCLDEDELIRMSKLVIASEAQYVKTSSGFNSAGGTLDEIKLIHKTIGTTGEVKISGLGGNLTFDLALEYINAGATRIGTRLACPMMDTIRQEMTTA